jgi:hypothetical protein
LKSGGSGVFEGSVQPGSRNSSKNSWPIASSGVKRAVGVYWRILDTRSVALAGVRGRNTRNGNINIGMLKDSYLSAMDEVG